MLGLPIAASAGKSKRVTVESGETWVVPQPIRLRALTIEAGVTVG